MLTQTIAPEPVISPARILQTGLGFWSSKVLLTAVHLNLFSHLSEGEKTGEEIGSALGLHPRGLYDFLDALVSLNFLNRDGAGHTAIYCNTPETEVFLDRKKKSYVGGMLAMANNRLFPAWNGLEAALKTGSPQNESKNDSESVFEAIYADQQRLEEFLDAMAGVQTGNFIALAKTFDFSSFRTHCDIGGAAADLSIQIGTYNTHMRSISFDLPQVAPIAQRKIDNYQLGEQISVVAGNFFTDHFPQADVITMGNILHDWNLETKKMLIGKAYEALHDDGVLIVIENIIDDQRKKNTFGLLMSLNMLVETAGGFDYTAADFHNWATAAGFARVEALHLVGPSSALIAYK